MTNVANVAFRTAEPVREFFERNQALALHAGSVDGFFTTADLAALADGANERWVPGPGYHDRIFRSTENISGEGGHDTLLQHYGVYLPKPAAASAKRVARAKSRKARRAARAAGASPLQLWLHWRGGTAHSAGAHDPAMFTDLGDAHDTIVISPRGRGSSSWYVGKGHADVMEVWADVHRLLRRRRATAATSPATRWAAGARSCSRSRTRTGSRRRCPPRRRSPRAPGPGRRLRRAATSSGSTTTRRATSRPTAATRARSTRAGCSRTCATCRGRSTTASPTSSCPYTGVTRQVERLVELGYRHRYYSFPTQEHFGPPVWDQWAEGAHYMHSFTRPENPARVTFIRDMPFEKVIETGNKPETPALDIDFDRAYWMSDLEPRDANGVARFDGRSLAIADKPHLPQPEAGGPVGVGQTGPFVMTGLAWLTDPLNAAPAKQNAIELTLRGVKSVRIDAERAGLKPGFEATIDSDGPVRVEFVGADGEVTVRESGGAQRRR